MCEDAERLEESLDTDAAHAPFGEDIGFGWQGLERRLDRIAEVAKELVALDCDVIFAAGPYAIEALMKATASRTGGSSASPDPVVT
jgi:hypothetical protein